MEKIELRISIYGEPVLRKKSRQVKGITERHREILSRMAQLMYSSKGIGLAAPQVGINESMIVVDIGSGLYKLVNPCIVKREGKQVMEEGCLSFPGVAVKITRAKRITLKAQDEFGKPVSIEAQDLLATVLQHEIDHLQGRLIIDYASVWERLRLQGKLRMLAKKAKEYELSK